MRDTVDNNEHLYVNRHYYIDKLSGLPGLITITARSLYNGAINNYYNETRYSNYKADQPNISVANFEIPLNYRPRGELPPVPSLLDTGIDAPDWTLFDANGKKLSLTQLKGKVVLLDFYFIGCSGCMASIQPLNAIYEKYKNKGLVIASLSERDSKRAVLEFEKHYSINYAGYINAADVVKSYHVTGFPTFYFIDKAGKINSAFVGYGDDFQPKAMAIIDTLLNNTKK
ncbi:TlpA disulfide reductase family protein [Mucilaginibacter sp. CAU 1740]|uniref:peroxiredoxin family protein n=1 Tax=Mucilaginibacter sp. CAU 1740 TaxID=3140365 RepID=UPI00325B223B